MHYPDPDSPKTSKQKMKALKSKLKQRLITPIEQGAQVQIRNIIVTHKMDETGEFDLSGEDLVNDVKRKDESEDDLIERMMDQIKSLGFLAAKQHLKDNFEAPNITITSNSQSKKTNIPHSNILINQMLQSKATAKLKDQRKMLSYQFYKMKPNNVHNITQLVTSEYFFYPHKDRGPLSQKGFETLIKKIEIFAKRLPANLHLVLATFPVQQDDEENAKNINPVLISVQCGKIPSIKVKGKSFLAAEEPIYPKFTNQAKVNFIKNAETLFENLTIYQMQLEEALSQNIDDKFNILNLIEEIQVICEYDCTYPPPIKLLNLLNELYLVLEADLLEDISAKIYNFNISISISEYIEEIMNKLKSINSELPQYFNYSQSLSPEGKGIDFFNHIDIETTGGVKVRAAIDICYDHKKWVTKVNLENEIQHNLLHLNQVTPKFISQIVTSHPMSLKAPALITEDKVVVHADSRDLAMGVFNKAIKGHCEERLLNSTPEVKVYFGKTVKLKIYERSPCSLLLPALRKELDIANQLTLELETKRIYRAQRPREYEKITYKIENIYLKRFIDRITKFCSVNSDHHLISASISLKNDLFFAYLVEKSERRELWMNLLKEHTKDIKQNHHGASDLLPIIMDFYELLNEEEVSYQAFKKSQKTSSIISFATLFQMNEEEDADINDLEPNNLRRQLSGNQSNE